MTASGSPRPYTLVNRMLLAQIMPLAVVAVVLLIAGAWTSYRVVERTSDRLLAGAMEIIRESVTLEDGRISVDVAPWSLALLDSPERDAVFYSVRDGETLVTGYDELPILPNVSADHPVFADLVVRRVPVRMAQQSVLIPGRSTAVVVSVAQSLDSRRASVAELNRILLLLPGLLVVLAALLVWPATVWGLSALRRLTRELATRSAAEKIDFAPAPVDMAPRELVPILSAFNNLLAGLERSTSGMQRFSADASHQLRTPLTVLGVNLHLLSMAKRPWTRTEQRLLADSRDAVDAMTRLTRQLLSTARADGELSGGAGDAAQAARRAVQTAIQARAQADVVRARIPSRPIMVRGDDNLIYEQVVNLIDNAFLYGAAPVFVQVEPWGDQVRIKVWDHGPGAAEDDLTRLTERFYRGRGNTTTEGSGLGLSIVASFAAMQGATLDLTNRRRRNGLIATLTFAAA
jgi:two-component system, OmpR family, sensor histidine kinase TctE